METTNYLGSAGVNLVIQAALLVIAVIAARRYKLTGLWILTAAVLLTVLRDVMELVSSSLVRAGHDDAAAYGTWLQYVPLVTMVLVFCGWCVLAFSHKQAGKA